MYITYSSFTVTTLTLTYRNVGDLGRATANNNQPIAIALGTVGATAFLCCIIVVICVCIKSHAKRRTQPVTQTGVHGPPIHRSITPVTAAVGIPSENSIVNVPVATATATHRPPVHRSTTPVAAAVGIPTENSMVNVPVTTTTVIPRMVTVDVVTILPVSMEDMETLLVAVAATI